jgi:hemolysin activation/secretion protein
VVNNAGLSWRQRPPLWLVAACVALVFASASALAAPVELPGAVQPGRDRPTPQIPALPGEYDFSIEAPHRSPVPRSVDEIHFKLNDIHIVGVVTFPPEHFRLLYENLLGKDVTLSDILDVADHIEDEYRRAGYPLARAYVPPQHVGDGVFTIKIVEGYVASVSVEGGGSAARERIKTYLQPVIGEKPLRLATLERALLLSNDLPGVTATGVLRPSPDTVGASELAVTIAEPRVSGGLGVDNRGSRLTGIWTVTGDVEFNSLLDDADQLAITAASTPTSSERYMAQARYSHSIGTDGLVGSLIGTYAHGVPGSFLSLLNVITDSWAVGPRLSYPLIRTRDETLSLDGGFTVQDARIRVLSTPLSHDQWRVIDLGMSYNRRDDTGGYWNGTLDVAQGLPILGATSDQSPLLSRVGASTTFTKFTGTLGYLHSLGGPFTVALQAVGQYAFKPLIEGEQITFGGAQIGRGYDPGAITGDQGIGGSAELRYSGHLPEYWVEALQPYIFLDGAEVWNIDQPSNFDFSIASTGAGIRLWFPYNIVSDVEVARTLNAVPGSDNGKRATKLLVNGSIRF